MITGITGRLLSIEGFGAQIALETGLTYEVLVPGFLLERLADKKGASVTLVTMEYLEPVGGGTSFTPRLVGFETPMQRRFLELMTSCKGMGTRKALRSMALDPTEIALLIVQGDARGLQKLPEIGKRLAETIIAELHDKAGAFVGTGIEVSTEPKRARGGLAGAWGESVAALVALGQSPDDAEVMVRTVQTRRPELDSADAIVAAAFGRD